MATQPPPDPAAVKQVITRLLAVADDDQLLCVQETARKAGFLWSCKCDYYNPVDARQCEACRRTRPQAANTEQRR